MNLAEVFDRATDEIASPGLAPAALAAADRRHAHRRVLAASAAVAAVVVGTGTVVASQGGDERPSPGRTPTPGVTTPPVEDPPAFDPAEQPLWDPRTLAQAPVRGTVLPERLEPPTQPPSVADQPMDAAVIAWPEEGEDVRLLGTDGQWRCIEGTDDVAGSQWWYSNPALSSDGTQVALSSKDGILVVDVTTGEQEVFPWPDALRAPWDAAPEVRWLPEDAGLAAFFWNDNWTVDLDGEWREAPFPRAFGSTIAIDPAGPIVQNSWRTGELVEWQGEEVANRVRFPYQGERFVAGYGRTAFTTGSLGSVDGYVASGPAVADTTTGELLAFRPIRDPHSTYSDNGHLTAVGFLDADTVLYLVGPARYVDRRLVVDAWHLVTWDVETGEFERVATGPEGMRMIDVAVGVLAGG